MSGNHLAITSVPIQEWGELYNEQEALNIGTIFHDLNMPFFAAESVLDTTSPLGNPSDNVQKEQKQIEREQQLTKIYEISFFLDDLTLYLDTHEKDMQALHLYHEKVNECAELKKKFAQEFYPLSSSCIPYALNNNEESFCWQEGPTPWEGACI